MGVDHHELVLAQQRLGTGGAQRSPTFTGRDVADDDRHGGDLLLWGSCGEATPQAAGRPPGSPPGASPVGSAPGPRSARGGRSPTSSARRSRPAIWDGSVSSARSTASLATVPLPRVHATTAPGSAAAPPRSPGTRETRLSSRSSRPWPSWATAAAPGHRGRGPPGGHALDPSSSGSHRAITASRSPRSGSATAIRARSRGAGSSRRPRPRRRAGAARDRVHRSRAPGRAGRGRALVAAARSSRRRTDAATSARLSAHGPALQHEVGHGRHVRGGGTGRQRSPRRRRPPSATAPGPSPSRTRTRSCRWTPTSSASSRMPRADGGRVDLAVGLSGEGRGAETERVGPRAGRPPPARAGTSCRRRRRGVSPAGRSGRSDRPPARRAAAGRGHHDHGSPGAVAEQVGKDCRAGGRHRSAATILRWLRDAAGRGFGLGRGAVAGHGHSAARRARRAGPSSWSVDTPAAASSPAGRTRSHLWRTLSRRRRRPGAAVNSRRARSAMRFMSIPSRPAPDDTAGDRHEADEAAQGLATHRGQQPEADRLVDHHPGRLRHPGPPGARAGWTRSCS